MTEPSIPRRLVESFKAKEPPDDFASRVVQTLGEPALSEAQTTRVDPPRQARRRLPSQALWWAAGTIVGAAVTLLAVRIVTPEPAIDDASSRVEAEPLEHARVPAPASAKTSDEINQTSKANPSAARTIARTAKLVVDTEPSATVFANGKKLGPTPLRETLEPGNYKLEIRSAECGNKVLRVKVAGGQTIRKRLELCDAPAAQSQTAQGKVRLATDPWSEVYFRGKKLGTTPGVFELPEGKQTLDLVHRESGCELSVSVDVRANITVSKRLSFTIRECKHWQGQDAPSSEGDNKGESMGTLTLATIPWSKVFLDGKEIGVTPLARKPMPVGVHQLKLRNEAAACEKEILVEVKRNENTSLRLLHLCN